MQEGLSLKVERVINVIFRTIKLIIVRSKNITKDIARPDMLYFTPDRSENLLELGVAGKPLPVEIVMVNILLKTLSIGSAVVPPRITTEEFIATASSQDYLNEFTCDLRCIVIGIALTNPGSSKCQASFGKQRSMSPALSTIS